MGDGGLPLRWGLRCASNLIFDEIDSIVRDFVVVVNVDNVPRAFFDRVDNGRLLGEINK